MIKYRNAHIIANEIRMKRSLFSGCFIIVEGPSDYNVYGGFFSKINCSIIPSFKKENAIEALNILEIEKFEGVIAIVDSDFWKIEKKENISKNLFVTDTHDLETMMIKSPALDKILIEYGSRTKIPKYLKITGLEIRINLLNLGTPIGHLRWISIIDEMNLDFEELQYIKFVDKKI